MLLDEKVLFQSGVPMLSVDELDSISKEVPICAHDMSFFLY